MKLWKFRLAQIVSATQPGRKRNFLSRQVLMYHSVGKTEKNNIYRISEDYFATHVEFLFRSQLAKKFTVSPFESEQENSIAITFDDGYSDTLRIAAKLLCEKTLPFTVFVTTQNISSGDPKYLNKSQLLELSKMSGVTIGSHGSTHMQLGSLSTKEVRDELEHSKAWIEDVIEKPVNSLSYPHGSYNPEVMRIASEVGYKYGATSDWGRFTTGSNLMQIPRIDIWAYDTMPTLRQKLSGKWDWI